jgi:hypothetical protein
MRKVNIYWFSLAGIILFLIMGNLISEVIDPVKVQSEILECKSNKCTLKFELYNDSYKPQTGFVTVHYRQNSSFAAAKGVRVFRTIKKPFEIDASGSVSYSDSFSTRKKSVAYYFAISTTKT